MDLYWLYLLFVLHIVNPVSVFVVDSRTGLQLQSGQIGSLAAALDWSEVRLAVFLSLIVFTLATLVANAIAKTFANPRLAGLHPSVSAA
jgi:hypothetical protein